MIESPLIQELVAEKLQRAILEVLKSRLGKVPLDIRKQLKTIVNERRLNVLIRHVATCPSFEAFRAKLLS